MQVREDAIENDSSAADGGHLPIIASDRRANHRAKRLWRRARKQRMAMVGVAVFALVVLAAVLSPFLVPLEQGMNLASRLRPPMSMVGDRFFLLGTDYLGRDIFRRILHGSSISLFIGGTSVICSALVGVTLGILAGYFGRSLDSLIMRLVDVQLAFPFVLLTIAILGIYGSSMLNIIIVFTVTSWPIYARTVRASVLSLKENEYLLAARSVGASNMWIIRKHVLPNCVSPLLVVASYELARMIILESALGFLGLGIQPPAPTWGNMLGEGRQYITTAWWLVTFPGLAIMLTVASINFIGDGLRDLLDVRQV
jgi:peptide/nickel transport system permease protein